MASAMAAMVTVSPVALVKGLPSVSHKTAASPSVMFKGRPSVSLKSKSTRSARLVIRAISEGDSSDTSSGKKLPSIVDPVITSEPLVPGEKPDFKNLMAFDGAIPEIINGRLAMLGFITAIGVEIANHSSLLSQIGDTRSLSWFALSVALISTATLIPMLQGLGPDSESSPFWSRKAELWNGRAAMLGFVALGITEYAKGSSLI